MVSNPSLPCENITTNRSQDCRKEHTLDRLLYWAYHVPDRSIRPLPVHIHVLASHLSQICS